jgi:hypothetical protein
MNAKSTTESPTSVRGAHMLLKPAASYEASSITTLFEEPGLPSICATADRKVVVQVTPDWWLELTEALFLAVISSSLMRIAKKAIENNNVSTRPLQ